MDIDKNVSQLSTTDSFNNSDNNEFETGNHNDVPAATSSLHVNENLNITVNSSVNDDDIGLYVSKKLGIKPTLVHSPSRNPRGIP